MSTITIRKLVWIVAEIRTVVGKSSVGQAGASMESDCFTCSPSATFSSGAASSEARIAVARWRVTVKAVAVARGCVVRDVAVAQGRCVTIRDVAVGIRDVAVAVAVRYGTVVR